MSNMFVEPFSIDNAGGVAKYCCVVQGASDQSVKLPTAANAAGFVGVTVEPQVNQNKSVGVVRPGGLYWMTAGGTITRGDRVGINSAAGDVVSIEASITAAPGTAKVWNVVGRAEASAVSGDVFPVFLQDYSVNIAVS